MTKLTKFGELLNDMLDHPESWTIYLKYKNGGTYNFYLHYKEREEVLKYKTWSRTVTTCILKLDVSEKWKFDIKQSAVLSEDDKRILWPKAEQLREALVDRDYPTYRKYIKREGEFDMSCKDETRTRNRNKYYKKVYKEILGVE